MLKLISSGLIFVLVGCASSLEYSRENYTVTEVTGKNHLELNLNLPPNTSDQTSFRYALRATGEECAARGFNYFLTTTDSASKHSGFCYSTDENRGLGIMFTREGTSMTPRRFIVEAVSPKPTSLVKIGDEALEMDKMKLTSMAQIRSHIHSLPSQKNHVVIKIIRDGEQLEVKEPLALIKGGVMSRADLEEIRKASF